MKQILLLTLRIIFITSLLSCKQSHTTQTQTNSDVELEVIYFHTSERCPACIAIENNTIEVLNEDYKTQIDSGIIRFTNCNIDEKANKLLVEKYQVSYLTLLLVKADGTKTDFTITAVQNAALNPEKFKDLLKAEIDKSLR